MNLKNAQWHDLVYEARAHHALLIKQYRFYKKQMKEYAQKIKEFDERYQIKSRIKY